MEIATKSRPVSAADAPIDPTKKSCHADGSSDVIAPVLQAATSLLRILTGVAFRNVRAWSAVVKVVARVRRILLLSGSLRKASTNSAVLRTILRVVPGSVEATLYEGLAALPAFNPDDDGAPFPTWRDWHTPIAPIQGSHRFPARHRFPPKGDIAVGAR